MERLQPILDAAQGAPLVAYVPAAVGLVAGFLLLFAGNKVLKPVTLVLGAAVGGLFGVVMLTSLLEGHTYDCPAALAAMGVGAIVGGLIALGVFRAALALAGAATFAGLAVLVTGVVLSRSTPTTLAKIDYGVNERLMLVSHALDPSPSVESPEAVATTAKVLASHAWDRAMVGWNAVPDSARARLILAALGAGVVGLLAGTFMPRKIEALVTALLGGALLLVSLTWLSEALDVPGAGLLDHGALGWLVIWGGVSAVGIAVQVTTSRKAAAPAAK